MSSNNASRIGERLVASANDKWVFDHLKTLRVEIGNIAEEHHLGDLRAFVFVLELRVENLGTIHNPIAGIDVERLHQKIDDRRRALTLLGLDRADNQQPAKQLREILRHRRAADGLSQEDDADQHKEAADAA